MLIDWIALGVFAAAVVTCAVIVWRKLPQLSSIRIESIPKHQQEARKQEILDQRLHQKLGNVEARIVAAFRALGRFLSGFMVAMVQRLRNLERDYRRKVVTQKAIDNPEVLRARVATLLADGHTAFDTGDLQRAEQCFVDVVSMDPKSIDAYLGLADVAVERKDYANAREALQFVLKLQQDSDVAYARLGKVASSEGNLEEAKVDLLKSVSLNAAAASTHADLAEIELNMGHVDLAQKALEEAIRLEPANPKYLDALLDFAIAQKRKPLAKQVLERLREANPENQKLAELAETVANL